MKQTKESKGVLGTYWIFVIGHVIESKKAEESIKQITKQIEAGVLNLRRSEAATNKKAWIKRHKIISRRNRVNGYVSSVSSSGVVRWKPDRYEDSNEDSDDSDLIIFNRGYKCFIVYLGFKEW